MAISPKFHEYCGLVSSTFASSTGAYFSGDLGESQDSVAFEGDDSLVTTAWARIYLSLCVEMVVL